MVLQIHDEARVIHPPEKCKKDRCVLKYKQLIEYIPMFSDQKLLLQI